MQPIVSKAPLGDRAVWCRVGYVGKAFAPAPGTYPGTDPLTAGYITVGCDGGEELRIGSGLANLSPLVAAALYEIGFARDAGPLSTWTN